MIVAVGFDETGEQDRVVTQELVDPRCFYPTDHVEGAMFLKQTLADRVTVFPDFEDLIDPIQHVAVFDAAIPRGIRQGLPVVRR